MAIVWGVNPVVELLEAQPASVERVYLAEGLRPQATDRILVLVRGQGVPIERVPKGAIERLAAGKVHQGVAAKIKEPSYAAWEDLLEHARSLGEDPFLLALDQVQDPIHLGAALRSAHAFGSHGLIIPKDRAVGLTAAAIKASAGAAARLRVARETNLARTLDELKRQGVWVLGAEMGGEPCDRVDLRGPVCLVVGGEGKGLRQLTKERCDRLVSIPMQGVGANSLSASAAASVLLYEIARQRRGGACAQQ